MATAIPVQVYIGYDWLISASLTDASGVPLNISTWTIAGDLWLPFQTSATPTVIPATNVNLTAASFQFFVPKATTAQILPQQPTDPTGQPVSYRCRIMVNYTDGSGDRFALRPIFILPLDPRNSTL